MVSKRSICIGLVLLALLAGTGACTPATTVTPETEPDTYTLTAKAITEGGQISPASITVQRGESATFQINASEGYLASNIEGCPGTLEGDQFVIEFVTGDCDLEVSFSPAFMSVKTVLVEKNVWEYSTSERIPDFEYAGVQNEGGLVFFVPSGYIVADLWQDGYPDVFFPFVKGHSSGIDTSFPPLLFKNDGHRFQEASEELIGGMPAIPGLRRTVAFSRPGDGFDGIFGIGHDWGNGNAADAILLAAGVNPENATHTLPRLPLADALGRATAVDAHSLAGGDLNNDGMTDFIVGEFSWLDNPYKLIQIEPGKWQVVEDPFLASLAYGHPMENPGAGNGDNLLLDLHLADVDGDSFDDLVVGWGHGSTKSYVYINDGSGGFSDDHKIALPVSIYGVDNSLHLRTWSLYANGDDYLDLLIIYSRFVPYYGGYTFQLLLNDGTGNFQDHSAESIQYLEKGDKSMGGRLQWSDEFYLIDVNHDGLVDIIGSDWDGVRLWLHEPGAVFREVPVDTPYEHRGGTHVFVDMGNGSVSSLVFRQGQNSEGTETRIWFDQADLVMETLPMPTPTVPVPTPSSGQFEGGYVIYSDELTEGWSLDMWGGTVDLFSSTTVYQGSRAIAITLDPGSGFTFPVASFDASAYDYLVFYLNGGDTADQELSVLIPSESGAPLGAQVDLADFTESNPLQPGTWHRVAIPLNLLNPESKPISWIDFKDASGNGAATFYIDEIRFVATGP